MTRVKVLALTADGSSNSRAVRRGRWIAILLLVGLIGCHSDAATNVGPARDKQLQSRSNPFLGSKAGDEREVAGVRLCWCPPGRFVMGSPANEPQRRPGEAQVAVTLSRGFWIGKYEVTQGHEHVARESRGS